MRAIILAGGRGTRLDPLTRNLPKPLVPFFDRPLIARQIEWLAGYGYDEIFISVGHLGEQIVAALGRRHAGAELVYVHEAVPLGTAGAVALALEHMGDQTAPVLVIPGDALADYDLAAVRTHFLARSEAIGMVVRQVEDPRGFGVVVTDPQGRVVGFEEKPTAVAAGRPVNTGIYCLRPRALTWPKRRPLDFAYDVFPSAVAARELVALNEAGYWSDVGTLAQYRRAHFDALDGRVRGAGGMRPSCNVMVDRTARLIAPVWLGDGVTVDARARVGPYAVIGAGSYLGPWSRVERAVLGQAVFLGAGTQVAEALIADRVVMGGRCRVGRQAVIGADARLGWGTEVGSGRHLDPATRVAPTPLVTPEGWEPASLEGA